MEMEDPVEEDKIAEVAGPDNNNSATEENMIAEAEAYDTTEDDVEYPVTTEKV